MPPEDTHRDDEAELMFLLKRAGHDLPEDRKAAVVVAYQDLKAMTKLLRQPRTAAAEPATIYSLDTITRSS